MIRIENISKSFHDKNGSFRALDQVSLDVEQGEILGIIGSSGAGKSTLIRCVNLLERPDEGRILFRGKDLTGLNARQLAGERKKIGMIFQQFNLLSSRTVSGNVALPLELQGMRKEAREARVTELLNLVGLAHKAGSYPAELSGGQKQRVAIARALANEPSLLLCDEATSALDPATTQSILRLLREINQRLKITILLITHEMEVVKTLCDRIVVIDKGRIVARGTWETLLIDNKHPVINQFIHTPTMSIPQSLNAAIRQEYEEGLFPLIEVELNGNISFDRLIDMIYYDHNLPYRLVKAEVEYLGRSSFGKLLLQLKGSPDKNERLLRQFSKNQIKHILKGYV